MPNMGAGQSLYTAGKKIQSLAQQQAQALDSSEKIYSFAGTAQKAVSRGTAPWEQGDSGSANYEAPKKEMSLVEAAAAEKKRRDALKAKP